MFKKLQLTMDEEAVAEFSDDEIEVEVQAMEWALVGKARILNLPLGWMNKQRGSWAMELLGEVKKVDVDADVGLVNSRVNQIAKGGDELIQELCHLVEIHKPVMAFLMETNLPEDRAVDLKHQLGFPNGIAVVSEKQWQFTGLYESDHYALVIKLIAWGSSGEGGVRDGAKIPFRYDNMWQRHEVYMEFVKQTWDPGLDTHDLRMVSTSLKRMQDEMRQEVHEGLQIPTDLLRERYLGLPTSVGKVADGTFTYVATRVRSFVCGWGENELSYAAREVLIKGNAQAVPTYPMSCFKLPVDQLFYPGTRVWNEPLIRDSFIRMDGEEIMKLKPGRSMPEDTLAWAPERHGNYSVKSTRLKAEKQRKEMMDTAGSSVKEIVGKKLPKLHPLTWAKGLLKGNLCGVEDAGFFICDVWSLWTGRNARNHGCKQWSAKNAIRHVSKMLEELLCMRTEVNCDGSFDSTHFSGGGGAIARDHSGTILMAEAKWHAWVPDALTAEALAARDGVLLAHRMGFNKVLLELHNLQLAQSLNNGTNNRSPISGLWHEIMELGRNFSEFRTVFVRTEGNQAAHFCAKLADRFNPICSWTADFPSGMWEGAVKDCISTHD
ncbi:hypothetical protein PR202_gb29337 [Eleusine coracana subsp. coracana]|uniref:RNase H type-1 domain-containing protein n=1 Tax=Eleusine coracana subsp. coracana TaxID=191504 RepID=A0AAV5FZ66_ELECO|nr:hypothetical protein PR202_gb29337 [Eleusine coracana subsp. coracana]